MNLNDTIAAISTPLGESGIGIVRLSGPDAVNIIKKIFIPYKKIDLSKIPSHSVRLGYIHHNGTIIDEVLICIMRAPKTYTREDIVEISAHGGSTILKKILRICLQQNSRLAEPGEFTKRAFLNGRLDLTQAEAVCDLIRSKTEFQASLFVRNLKGELKDKIQNIRKKLIDLISHLDVSLDYPEEDIKFITDSEIKRQIEEMKNEIEKILQSIERGRIFTEGTKIAIIGKPNTGKSSLFNCLAKENRAIVTSIPGTTRDTIDLTFNLNNIPITIIDSAGIKKHTQDLIEELGVERAMKILNEAEIILWVCDASQKLSDEDFYISKLLDENLKNYQKVIIVLNKCDLPQLLEEEKLENFQFHRIKPVKISALYNQNIDELEKIIYSSIIDSDQNFRSQDVKDNIMVANLRQENILKKILKNLENCSSIKEQEIIPIYLRTISNLLGEITGEITTEEILDNIFSNFCVGK